ncbi:hypothetical protein DPMN_054971, partial [Dreissena polymorpha]
NRVEIEKRSDEQRTVIARRALDIGFIVRVSERASPGVCRASCGGNPAIRRSPADVYASGKYLYLCRYTFNESDVGRSPGNTRALIVRSCFDLNSIPSRARRRWGFERDTEGAPIPEAPLVRKSTQTTFFHAGSKDASVSAGLEGAPEEISLARALWLR